VPLKRHVADEARYIAVPNRNNNYYFIKGLSFLTMVVVVLLRWELRRNINNDHTIAQTKNEWAE